MRLWCRALLLYDTGCNKWYKCRRCEATSGINSFIKLITSHKLILMYFHLTFSTSEHITALTPQSRAELQPWVAELRSFYFSPECECCVSGSWTDLISNISWALENPRPPVSLSVSLPPSLCQSDSNHLSLLWLTTKTCENSSSETLKTAPQLHLVECILRNAFVGSTERKLGAVLREDEAFPPVSQRKKCHMGGMVLAQGPAEASGNKKRK